MPEIDNLLEALAQDDVEKVIEISMQLAKSDEYDHDMMKSLIILSAANHRLRKAHINGEVDRDQFNRERNQIIGRLYLLLELIGKDRSAIIQILEKPNISVTEVNYITRLNQEINHQFLSRNELDKLALLFKGIIEDFKSFGSP